MAGSRTTPSGLTSLTTIGAPSTGSAGLLPNRFVPSPTVSVAPSVNTGTGTPTTATAAPALTPEQIDAQAKGQVAGDMTAGSDWANTVLPDGTLSRLGSDDDVKDYLSKLKDRTSGMTPDELRAEYEQGTANSNGVLATNLARANQISGNAGVRGGAAAGLQMQALNHSIDDQAALQRQMVLDNIGQKNAAFAAYGPALMGVKTYDAGQGDKEKIGRISLGTEYGGMIDSARTGIKSDITAADSTQLAKDYLKKLGPGGAAGAGTNNTGSSNIDANGDPVAGTPQDLAKMSGQSVDDSGWVSDTANGGADAHYNPAAGAQYITSDNAKLALDHNFDSIKDKYPGITPEQLIERAKTDPAVRHSLFIASHNGSVSPAQTTAYMRDVEGYGADSAQFKQQDSMLCKDDPNALCWIATAASQRGALVSNLYRDIVDNCPISDADRRAYNKWGKGLAEWTKKEGLSRKFIDLVLVDTLNAMRGRPYGWRGVVGLVFYRTMNMLTRWLRPNLKRERT